MDHPAVYSVFKGNKKITTGSLVEVALKSRATLDRTDHSAILVFDHRTSKVIDLDLRGSVDEVRERYETSNQAGPGRPKLGVVSREISLLPGHWEWLSIQSGGASGVIRRLIDEAKKKTMKKDEIRVAQDATYQFMRVMAGDSVGYEETLRALYANEKKQFLALIAAWPKDIQSQLRVLAEPVFFVGKKRLKKTTIK